MTCGNVLSIILVFGVYLGSCSIYENLKYFDTLHSSELRHHIVKRGLKESSHPFNKIKEVHFKTLGRDFRLILTPRKGVLHSNFQAYSVDGDGKEKPVAIDHEDFYEGRMFGEKWSHASVHLDDGVMTATISLPDETYHIEPSWRHLPELGNESMVAYRESDVRLSWHGSNGPCAYAKEGPHWNDTESDDEEFEDFKVASSQENRVKRQAEYEYTPTKTRCPLLLVADYRFYQEMGDRVHKIYNDTTWQDRAESEGFKGMGFVIKKIVVHSEPTRVRGGEAHYNMIRDKWDVRNLLEVFSRDKSGKEHCLSHLFTHQTFRSADTGFSTVLGLAYIASPRARSPGGICSDEYFKNGYTLYLNSGLSSSRNHYGQRVITREADLVTAHEFGHNWGSEHDPDMPECSPPASQGGSYLMYTYSVSGYDVNNKRFSPCSLRSIRKVLQAKSGRCFSEPEESFCGNLRVEGDEECDAGLLGTEDNDACCDKVCKLRRNQGAVCSDKNSPCCQNCRFMAYGIKCREAQYSTCEQEAVCSGTASDCPKSASMKDGTECLEKGKCTNGKCVPYCETKGLQSCMCDTPPENACKRCCRMNLNATCFPVQPADILPDGTPCIHGFCNHGVCEKTIQDVVERFWDIIEDININKVLVILRDNVVGAVIIVTSLIWIPASCLINYIDRKRLREEEEARGSRSRSRDLWNDTSKQFIPIKVLARQQQAAL
ncbi:unnamed protein product [Nezara viridula]|uniref:ADAM 17-like protease n=1 Tax=Nezara viridula TaxID=85310 RepID=A0A9P0MQH6_NEZVI|nr:unnamed protein product [Nezara viridula]